MYKAINDNDKYCKELVKKLDYGRYVQAAFAPRELQQALFAIFALNCELLHVRSSVSEEMLGHIRYAWWEESVAAFDKKHPVLESLAASQLPQEKLLILVNLYREAYPELPADVGPLLDAIIPLPERFHKAGLIIKNHQGGKLTLLAKLLLV